MPFRTAYLVIPADSEDLEAARAAGTEVLYLGDAGGVARFFGDLTQGLRYAVLATRPPDRRERVQAALMGCEVLAARMEALVLAVRALFPVSPGSQEMLLGTKPFDFEMDVITTLEQCLHDFLSPLRKELRRVVAQSGEEEPI